MTVTNSRLNGNSADKRRWRYLQRRLPRYCDADGQQLHALSGNLALANSGGGIATGSGYGSSIVTVKAAALSAATQPAGRRRHRKWDRKKAGFSTVTVINSTISGNSTTAYDGGGIVNGSSVGGKFPRDRKQQHP